MKELPNLYKRVVDWNKKAGSKWEPDFEYEWWNKVNLQAKLLVEESKETLESTEYNDATELLDGVCDVFVIWSYLAAQLEKAGFDVEGAIGAVCANNDSKILNSYAEAADNVDWMESQGKEGCYIEESYLNGLPFYTVRNDYGKIQKPKGFQSVDLKEYLPK